MSLRSEAAHPVCSSEPSRHVWKTRLQPCEFIFGLQFPAMLSPGQKSYLDFSLGGMDSTSITFVLLILACNIRVIPPVRKHTCSHLKPLLQTALRQIVTPVYQLHIKVFVIAKPMSKSCKRLSASKWKHFLGEEHQISRHILTIAVLWPTEAVQ